ncbi:MAG UNVERIFIED_CONTAM: hypothetical protein LVR18_42850 [Planctomycetaceae bacterium]
MFADGDITIEAGPAGDRAAKLVIGTAGSLKSTAGDISLSGVDAMTFGGELLASGGAIEVSSDGSITIASGSQIDAADSIHLTSGSDLTVDSSVGSRTAPLSLVLNAPDGTISVTAAAGRLQSGRLVLIEGETVDFDGALQTKTFTPAADDYEVRLVADTLQLSGSFSVEGSLEIFATTFAEIHDFTGDITGSFSRVLVKSDADLSIGRLTQNNPDRWISQSARISAPRGLIFRRYPEQ